MSNPIKLLLLFVSLFLFIRCQSDSEVPSLIDIPAFVEEYANDDSTSNYIQHNKFNLENPLDGKIYMLNNHKDSLAYIIVFSGNKVIYYYNRGIRGTFRKEKAEDMIWD